MATKINKRALYPTFQGNLILKGKIVCETGLHIGGSKDTLEIGGLDSPVIRHPITQHPYIPGSSIKGKMRSSLEYFHGVVGNEQDHKKGTYGGVSDAPEIVRIFGIGAEEDDVAKQLEKDGDSENKLTPGLAAPGPTRLTVRDANPDQYTQFAWENLESDLLYTELKSENTINRLTSAANPRNIERVVAGSRFDFEMIYGLYTAEGIENSQTKVDLDNLLLSLKLLQDGTLGKSGSRGYGKISIYLMQPVLLGKEDYQIHNSAKYKESRLPVSENLEDLLSLEEFVMPYPTWS